SKVHEYCGLNSSILILAPLSVCEQTKREGEKFGYIVNICESQEDVQAGINITNYEKIQKFDCSTFMGVVLDESSILKSFTGKTRNLLIDSFCRTKFRLACTATPAPNDYMELGNHAEFLGVMGRNEMLAMFFVHDGGDTSKWRLKKHAENQFWQWLASWSVFIDNPTNLGYKEENYVLPKLNNIELVVEDDSKGLAKTLTERRQARKDSIQERCQKAADLVNRSQEQWLVWCGLNDESKLLTSLIEDSKEIKGSDKEQYRTTTMNSFLAGSLKCLVTKPSIAGYGMNLQNCHNMIFVGLSDSFEQYYQAVRRCWRFGQEKEVNSYIVISSSEGSVLENIERKQEDYAHMREVMTDLTKEITAKTLRQTCKMTTEYNPTKQMSLPKWKEFRNACA
ncbi:MAG: helicase, partial [Allobaculum sp.]|nr:helicase [Allobaculum sp.]